MFKETTEEAVTGTLQLFSSVLIDEQSLHSITINNAEITKIHTNYIDFRNDTIW